MENIVEEITIRDKEHLAKETDVIGLSNPQAVLSITSNNSQGLPSDKEEAVSIISSLRDHLKTLSGNRISWGVDIRDSKVRFVARLAGGLSNTGIEDGTTASLRMASHLSELFDEASRTINATAYHKKFDNSALMPEISDASQLAIEFKDIPKSLEQCQAVIDDIRAKRGSVGRHVEAALGKRGISQFESIKI